MNSMNYCYFNGEIIPFNDCNIHISDLLIQRGYGVFDFFRCRNGAIPWLDDYIDRLFMSLQLSSIDIALSRQDLISIIFDLQKRNESDKGAFKMIVTGGYSDNLETVSGQANLIILNVPWQSPAAETFEKGVNLISNEYARPNPEVKTLNYFNLLSLNGKMKEFNAVDALYHNNLIMETSRASVFLVKGDRVYTPASNILLGITRKQVLAMMGNISVEDIPFNRLYEFNEMFITSTSRDITPVVNVDGRLIGDGKPGGVTREIQKIFREKLK